MWKMHCLLQHSKYKIVPLVFQYHFKKLISLKLQDHHFQQLQTSTSYSYNILLHRIPSNTRNNAPKVQK